MKATTPAAGKGIDSRVKNAHFNEALFGTYKTSALKANAIQDKIKGGTIPTLPFSKCDGAKLMCLAWHTKGVCNATGLCLYDHVAYSQNKFVPMVMWCHDHGYASA
jgi:hypothetical protein